MRAATRPTTIDAVHETTAATAAHARGWGLLPDEALAGGPWAGVVDRRRGWLRTVARAIGYVVLPHGMRRALMPADRSFRYAVTSADVLVLVGIDPAPMRLGAGEFDLDDSGERRSLTALVRGRLARVIVTSDDLELDLYVQEDSLARLEALARLPR